MTLLCTRCGTAFAVPPSLAATRSFCSRSCWRQQQSEETGWQDRQCAHCGKQFRARSKELAKGQWKHCSWACVEAAKAVQLLACPTCKQVFLPRDNARSQRYCSRECAGIARRDRVTRSCRGCGNSFEIKASKITTGRGWFCSRACYFGDAVQGQCERCGVQFSARPSEVARGWARYCSRACVTNQVDRTCAQCAQAFTVKGSVAARDRLYCSRRCYGLARRRSVRRECPVCQRPFVLPASAAAQRTHCSRACHAKALRADEHAAQVLAAARHRLLTSRAPTRPERALYALLDRVVPQEAPQHHWRRQHRVLNRWTVDAAIPTLRLVIQADGDYWHGRHAADRLHPKVAGNLANDARQDAALTAAGWQVLRLWGTDLTHDLPACEQQVRTMIRTGLAASLPESQHRGASS
ncbi:endonuclease domain-containing protein [Streptomyces sp. NPDC002738]